MSDSSEFRIGRSHRDIVYHHVEGRDYRDDPRYMVCHNSNEAELIRVLLNQWVKDYDANSEEQFKHFGLRW